MEFSLNEPSSGSFDTHYLPNASAMAPSTNNSAASRDTKASGKSGVSTNGSGWNSSSGATGNPYDSEASDGGFNTDDEEDSERFPGEIAEIKNYYAQNIQLSKDAPVLKAELIALNRLALDYAEVLTEGAWTARVEKYNTFMSQMQKLSKESWFRRHYASVKQEQTAPLVFRAYIKDAGTHSLHLQDIGESREMEAGYAKLVQMAGGESVIRKRWINACRFCQRGGTWNYAELALFAEMCSYCPDRMKEIKMGEEARQRHERGRTDRDVRGGSSLFAERESHVV